MKWEMCSVEPFNNGVVKETELKDNGTKDHPSYKAIPKFFDPPPKPEDKDRVLLLRREAHSLVLQDQAEGLLNTEELNELWRILEKHVTETIRSKRQLISLDDYLVVVSEVSAKCQKLLTVGLFFELMQSSNYPDMLEIVSIYNHIVRRISIVQGRIGLSSYDGFGQGYLSESDLESFITDIIPKLAQIRDCMQPSFERFYVCTVVKKIFFFLDHLHMRRIRIRDIVSSGLLSQLLELHDKTNSKEREKKGATNCFSMPAIFAVYENYLDLDKDHDGMLSREELSKYGSGSLTSIFLDRAFEMCRTYGGKMDYKSFLDFHFAMENRKCLPALHYIFRILDINQQGYLTAQTLRYFYDGIEVRFKTLKAEAVNFQDLKDEIFDMVGPKDPLNITLKDLINSGQGETVLSILIEFDKFLAHENREGNPQNV
ncbi:serine/threonine-protein phosphatase 2A regulatory subunit B'' subunit gamma-like isoform X2 [Drosophila biarmipes]|uniref:serine/threonine-protein phosphatase 2A regulatory subunit B'' subunit gamma-like isoform X2 n=1 Tax=Drosophila biarmipes TaxID=125945 RepID=UPI0007E5F3CE|nr:serine/threonine-protein phosphatase 2A regulatory subunit B'' subunit gamma-like isoform X2 [Drosophila biarmipes]